VVQAEHHELEDDDRDDELGVEVATNGPSRRSGSSTTTGGGRRATTVIPSTARKKT